MQKRSRTQLQIIGNGYWFANYRPIKCKIRNGNRFFGSKENCKRRNCRQFDHATVFNETTPHIELANELKNRGHHVILVDYQPTSENMVVDFADRIIARLPAGIKLFSLKLQETESSFAEWFASDNI